MASRMPSIATPRERTLILATVSLLVVVICFWGGHWYFQSRQQTGDQFQTAVLDPLNADPGVRAGASQARIDKAAQLRASWRGWAGQHQDLLRKMQASGPGDYAILDRVYATLPARPVGITDAALSGGACKFTWQPTEKIVTAPPSDPVMRAHFLADDQTIKDTMLRDFQHYHDVQISVSENAGPSLVVLWANGRVTEATTLDHHTSGQYVTYEKKQREILPPYEFLASPK